MRPMRKRDREFREMVRQDRLSSDRAFREFMREERLLPDKRFQQFTDEMRRMREDLHAHFEKQDRKIDEIIAEGRAGREALFRMMDRLDGGGTAPAG